MRSLLAIALAALAAGPAHAALIVSFTQAGQANTGVDFTTGFEFTTNAPVTVTHLAYTFSNTGRTSGDVRLYDGSGTVLASATVLDTDTPEIVGGRTYYVRPLANPVSLPSNGTFYIAGDIPASPGSGPLIFDALGLTTDPLISYVGPVSATGSPSTPTTPGVLSFANNGIFVVNFAASPTPPPPAPVPEPATAATLAALLGFGGLAARRRAART